MFNTDFPSDIITVNNYSIASRCGYCKVVAYWYHVAMKHTSKTIGSRNVWKAMTIRFDPLISAWLTEYADRCGLSANSVICRTFESIKVLGEEIARGEVGSGLANEGHRLASAMNERGIFRFLPGKRPALGKEMKRGRS